MSQHSDLLQTWLSKKISADFECSICKQRKLKFSEGLHYSSTYTSDGEQRLVGPLYQAVCSNCGLVHSFLGKIVNSRVE